MKREGTQIGKFSISIVCVILGVLLALQFKSVRQNNEALEPNAGRLQTLQRLLDDSREENDHLKARVEELNRELETYRTAAVGGAEKDERALLDELARLQTVSGLTDVVGPGVEVVLNDSTAGNTSDYLIHDNDLLSVINELRDAGAEALSLNGHRILSTTEVRCSGSVVTVNGRRTSAPFVIDAIGDSDTMYNALMMRNGVVDVLKQWSINVEVTPLKEILIEGYRGTVEYEYAKTMTEDTELRGETEDAS